MSMLPLKLTAYTLEKVEQNHMGLQKGDCLFLIIDKDHPSGRASKTAMYFDLYCYVFWPVFWHDLTGYHAVIYQQQDIIVRLSKIFLNLALIIFRKCVVNGLVKFEIQVIIAFLCEMSLVPTLVYLLLVVDIVLFKKIIYL